MSIEVEKKAIVDQDVIKKVEKSLINLGAKDLGKNNTKSVFYIHEDYQLKLQVRTSKNDAKIAWKSGGFNGASAREEIELPFAIKDADQAEELLDRLQVGVKQVKTVQKRHDYKLEDIEIALKWSNEWGYHIELDIDIADDSQIEEAASKLDILATKLGIKLMSEAEEKTFTDAIRKKLGV